MSEEPTEGDVIRELVSKLQGEGYEVFVEPRPPLSPAFLGSFVPDIVALKPDKKLIIEVTRSASVKARQLEKIAEIIRGQPSWDFQIVTVNPSVGGQMLSVQTADAIKAKIDEFDTLYSQGHTAPALLLGWATFEALARLAIPDQFKRPQSPGRLVQILAQDGYVTPTQADLLRYLADKRNHFIHGELDATVGPEELDGFREILTQLLEPTA